jgi:hypothetical protein
MFLLPILTIFFLSIEITFGTILVCIIAWLVSGYIIRLYLWNKYGVEVFIVNRNTLETYNDYKYFKDNHRVYDFTKLDIVFFNEDTILADESKTNHSSIDNGQLSLIGFKLDDEIILSHKEIPITSIIHISKQIKIKK